MSALHRIVRRLAEELRCAEQISRHGQKRPHFSTGIPPLDALLPGGGLCRGMLLEWLAADDEGGGTTLMGLLTAAGVRNAECGMRNKEGESASSSFRTLHSAPRIPLVVIDRHGTFYPLAAAGWGIPLANMILLRPADARDEAWALDQAIRSPAVSSVLAWPTRLDGRAFRRLQLAAESSGAIGILVRPASARHEPTWADARFWVGPLCQSGPDAGLNLACDRTRVPAARSGSANRISSWHLCIERLHARGSVHPHDPVHIEITPTGQIHEIAPVEQPPTRTHPHRSQIPNLFAKRSAI